ncbi:MFS transporter [Prevotella sp. P4-51]|uniref:MFS transporter n=1 Tax=unclassified Prevotella TaxID=2638335 RepID=UPI000B969D94|nr:MULTISPECIES: MFS transporter [unclassified Prevotella]OYP76626.1 MFS transporter [Prevotella sp. P4-67]OYP79336.1 MFS transporter [Prevotella sp. P4-51]
MIQLKENQGIPRNILLMMAIIAGLTVANCYYNQPLLELIRHDIGITEQSANLITVITQIGYALGLFFLIPLGDMFSRKRLILVNMSIAAVMAIVMAVAQNVWMLWGASLLIGACSVIPQFFIPIAGQFSAPKNKSRNMGFVLSGLLTGILTSRVISGYIGEWLGWREMFIIAAFVMLICMGVMLLMMPEMKRNYEGTYRGLMSTMAEIIVLHPSVRIYSIRAAFGFGSMMAIWSCLAFHLAQPPFRAGSDMVGMLGLCGIMGAVAASGIGKQVPKFGIRKFSLFGAGMQIMAWGIALLFGDTYAGLIAAIILVDIGLQCQQLSNQSECLQEIPHASNRANTIFMTTYFIGGSLGTFCAGYLWNRANWLGVCIVGITFAFISLAITLSNRK